METSPVKQPMVEEVVVREVQDDTGAAPMDTSDPVLPVREQAEVIAESAAVVQPENSVAEVSIVDQPERKVEIQPETNIVANLQTKSDKKKKKKRRKHIQAPVVSFCHND